MKRPVAKAATRSRGILPAAFPTLLALLGLLALLLVAVHASDSEEAMPSTSNVLVNPEGVVDRIVFLDTAEVFEAGASTRAAFDPQMGGIVLRDERERGFRRNGLWDSPEVEADFPFTEFIPSWNATTPQRTGISFFARVRDAETAEWSPWLFFGEWGETVTRPTRQVRFDGGVVHTDVLKLDRPADAFQVRARFEAFALGGFQMPYVRRIAASYSGVIEDDAERERLTLVPEIEGEWARSLEVPFIGQHSAPSEIGGSICSPTSVTMVMGYWGIERPLVENALEVYDPNYGIFGNWVRGTQLAASHGLDGWVTRMRSYDDVKAWIARGVPVIASIRFREGEFPKIGRAHV